MSLRRIVAVLAVLVFAAAGICDGPERTPVESRSRMITTGVQDR